MSQKGFNKFIRKAIRTRSTSQVGLLKREVQLENLELRVQISSLSFRKYTRSNNRMPRNLWSQEVCNLTLLVLLVFKPVQRAIKISYVFT